MELRMRSHRWERREMDLVAAAVSGFVAGALLMVLELVWTAFMPDAHPWVTSRRVAAILMGPEILGGVDFSLPIVSMALLTHYLLGIMFGLILGAIIAPFHFDSSVGMLLLVGAVFGLVLYGINFYAMVQVFPWIAPMRGWATLVANIIFGMAAASIYGQLESRDNY